MEKEQIFLHEKKPNISSRENGDLYVLDCPEKTKLLAIAEKIFAELDHSPLSEKAMNKLMDGEELRPGGCFAIRIISGKLWVDNKNGRGVEKITKQLKEAVESATN